MLRRLTRNVLVVAIVTLGGFVATGDLLAQDPKPTPIPTTRPLPIPVPQPTAKQPIPKTVEINEQVLRRPDLQPTLSPRSLDATPRSFTVTNAGAADAESASLLSVTVRLLPLDGDAEGLLSRLAGADPPPWVIRTSPDILLGEREPRDELTNSEFAELCAPPFEDFQAAIGPLAIGESQTVSQSGTRGSGEIRNVGLWARAAVRIPTHSYLRRIEVRLVCVYEVHATVDVNHDVEELNEGNNEVTHIFQREVTLR